MPEYDDYMSVREAAEELDISINTLYAYLNMGEVEGAFKFAGTRWMVPRQWVHDYITGYVDMSGVWDDWRKRERCGKNSKKK